MVEREWREASDMRQSMLTLAGIVGFAAVLRFWALGAGIPYNLGVDEPEVMNRAVHMMRTGDLNPRFYDYPTLYIYVQLAVACVRFLTGATAGLWRSLEEVGPEEFYLWGRAVTALLGTLTVLLVYGIGMRWGTRYAALAAGLMAVMPLHIRESHYVLTDVPLTFFVTLAFLLSLRAHELARTSAFAWAGVAAGLAAATKYPGALVLVLPLIAVWMTPGTHPSRLAATLAALVAAGTAFLVAAPYTVLDLPGFLNGYARLATYYTAERPEAAWLLYLKHLRNSMREPALVLAFAGLLLGCVRAARGPGRVRWMLAVTFPLLYFWFISRHSLVFGRYLLPLLPFLCILAAAAVVSGVSLLRRFDIPRAPRTALIAGLTIAALLPPALQGIGFNRMLSRTSTLAQAHQWILANVPTGSAIVVETRGLVLNSNSYETTNVPRLIRDQHGPREYDDYVSEGFEYVVASSHSFGPALTLPHQFPEDYAAYRRLFDQSRELARFAPSDEHPGPEIRIFKLK